MPNSNVLFHLSFQNKYYRSDKKIYEDGCLIANMLVKAGANTLHRDNYGNNLLSMAVIKDDILLLNYFIKKHKVPLQKDKKERTLLHLAVLHNHYKMVKYLIQQKFPPNQMDSNRMTPKELALDLLIQYKTTNNYRINIAKLNEIIKLLKHYEREQPSPNTGH